MTTTERDHQLRRAVGLGGQLHHRIPEVEALGGYLPARSGLGFRYVLHHEDGREFHIGGARPHRELFVGEWAGFDEDIVLIVGRRSDTEFDTIEHPMAAEIRTAMLGIGVPPDEAMEHADRIARRLCVFRSEDGNMVVAFNPTDAARVMRAAGPEPTPAEGSAVAWELWTVPITIRGETKPAATWALEHGRGWLCTGT